MVSEGPDSPPSTTVRSYLVMKAESEKALKLAEEWWGDKERDHELVVKHVETFD